MGAKDIQHDCWWTRRRLIEISYDGRSITGAGMGLRALTTSFPLDSNWHLRQFGEFDDDVLALSFSDHVAATLPTSASITLADADLPVSACALSDEICACCGIGMEKDGFPLPDEADVTREVRIHDDCFYFATPVGEDTLRTVVEEIIAIQASYLPAAIDTEEAQRLLEKLIHEYASVRVRSFPQKATIRASYRDPRRRFFRWQSSDLVACTSGHAI